MSTTPIVEHRYETQLDPDGETYSHHLPNPYHTDVERQAWAEGYEIGSAHLRIKEEGEGFTQDPLDPTENPYTSADTMVAWKHGYEDAAYFPAPFDIENMTPEAQLSIQLQLVEVKGDTRLAFGWPSWLTVGRPAWADNRLEHRSILFGKPAMGGLARQALSYKNIVPDGTVTLPCPPYEFSYENGDIIISKGAFTKSGSKSDWEGVIQMFQEAVDNAPSGYDISDVQIGVTVEVKASVTTYVSASSLIGEDEWYGDLDSLEEAIEDAARYGTNFEEYFDLDDIAYSMTNSDWSVENWEMTDANYDIQNGATEL